MKSRQYIGEYVVRGSIGISLSIIILVMFLFLSYVCLFLYDHKISNPLESGILSDGKNVIIRKYPTSYRQKFDSGGNIYYEGEVGGNIMRIYIGGSISGSDVKQEVNKDTGRHISKVNPKGIPRR